MIEIQNLCKSYGEKQALHDVSFKIGKGEIVGLIGKNGAGKSTILKSIAGLLDYNGGKILYNQMNCSNNPSCVQDFGILIDCAFLDYVSAFENLKLLYQLDHRNNLSSVRSVIDDAFELVGLSTVKHKRVKTYSFGMKQRLGLAQAIINARSFIMLDEPFIGLDPIGKKIVKKSIVKKAKEENYAVLFSSHDLDDVAEICDRLVMIDHGKCVYDGMVQRNLEYHVYIEDIVALDAIKKEHTLIQVQPYGFSLVDDELSPKIHSILETTIKITTIKKIETYNNTLRNMFKEGDDNESNL